MTEYADAEWDKVLDVNLKGVLYCVRSEFMNMEKEGSIVNISSVGGLRGFAGAAAYSAAKFGVRGLTRTTAQEAAGDRIRVNAICPSVLAFACLYWSKY
jgi:NAD(P)-dependent dehydrogenase (short-subunit alcohol dehydrogenase family)